MDTGKIDAVLQCRLHHLTGKIKKGIDSQHSYASVATSANDLNRVIRPKES